VSPTDEGRRTPDEAREQGVFSESFAEAWLGIAPAAELEEQRAPAGPPGPLAEPRPAGGDASQSYSGTGGRVDVRRQILEVEVVPELCLSFLNCMRIATGAFATDPATRKTRPARWREVDRDKLWKAGFSCPSGAIRFVTDTGYVVPRWEEAFLWQYDSHPAAGRRSPSGQ
jgi:hypothetical protein